MKPNSNSNGNESTDKTPNRIPSPTSKEGVGLPLDIKSTELYIRGCISAAEKELERQLTNVEYEDFERKCVLKYAKENGIWINDMLSLGEPIDGGGNENTLYLDTKNGILYKSNNLLNYKNRVDLFLEGIEGYNKIFTENEYKLVGFTGIDKGKNTPYIEPVISQQYIFESQQAASSQISDYMTSLGLGFKKINEHTFENSEYVVSDLRPRNVLINKDGNVHVIDAIVSKKIEKMEKGGSIPEYNVTLYTKIKGDKAFKATDLKGNQVGNLVYAPLIKPEMYLEFKKAIEKTAKENPDTQFQIREFKTDKVWYDSSADKTNSHKMKKNITITQNIKDFVPPSQIEVIKQGLKGEEKDYFEDILISLDKTIEEMPKVYGTDGIKLKDKIAVLHYFSGSSDWYIVEKDSEPEQLQAFGYVVLNGDTQNAELGYINIEELKSIKGVEIDLHWDVKKLGDVIEKKEPEVVKEVEASVVPEIGDKSAENRKKELMELFDKQLDAYEKNGKNKSLLNQIENELSIYWENVVSKNPEEFTGFLELQKKLPAKIKPMGSWAVDEKYSEDFKNNIKTNLWELIPSEFKSHKLPKKISYKPNHEDKNLAELIKPFASHDDLRISLTGVHFDKHGIAVTDAHKLLFLYHPDNDREENTYCMTNDCLKANEKAKDDPKWDTIDKAKYPQYSRVIPDNNQSVTLHTESLISYLETLIKIKYFNTASNQIAVTFGGGENSAFDITEMAFHCYFLLDGAKAMYKLGYDQIDIGYSVPSRAITMCKKGELKNVYKLQTDFVLIMPSMAGGDKGLNFDHGTMYFNMESECVSTKGIEDTSCLNPNDILKKELSQTKKEITETKKELSEIKAAAKAKEDKEKGNKEIAEVLMELDGDTWDKLGIKSGSKLYSDLELQEKYKGILDYKIKAIKIDYPLDMAIHDILEANNFDSLIQYLTLSNAFGEEKKSKWIDFLEKHKEESGNKYLNLHIFSPEPVEKLTKEVLASRLKILKKMDEKNPSAVLKTRIKLMTKMLANPEKFCCGGEMNHGGDVPKNLVSELKDVFPYPIEDFGITEIFIQDGEVRMTSNYDIPMDYAESIEAYVLRKEYNKLTEEYDLLGAHLEDAIENKDAKRTEDLKAKMNEVESKIHRFERSYARGGGMDEDINDIFVRLDKTSNGIYFSDYIASSQGASFVLFADGRSKEDIDKAKKEIRHDRDVVSLRLADYPDYVDLYKAAIFRHPKTKGLKYYEIEQDDKLLKSEWLRGTTVDEFVENIVIPRVEKNRAEHIEKYGDKSLSKGGSLKANDIPLGTFLQHKELGSKARVWNVDPVMGKMQLEDIYGNKDYMWRSAKDWKVVKSGKYESLAGGGFVKVKKSEYDKAYEKFYHKLMDEHKSIKEFEKKHAAWIKENAPKYGIEYAKGGLLEHGLKRGDTIKDDLFWDKSVTVSNPKEGDAVVNLDKGTRNEFKQGGSLKNNITAKDIIKGAKFKTKSGIVWIIDEVKEKDGAFDTSVRTSMEHGKKGVYRNELNDVVDFLNEEMAIKLAEGGKVGDMLQVDDMVWDSDGNKFEVTKKNDTEYFLAGYGSTFGKPVPKERVHDYIKNGQWTLLPKYEEGGEITYNKGAELDERKNKLLSEVKELSDIKKKLFGKVDISEPVSKEEKELTDKIAQIYSEINEIVKEKRRLADGREVSCTQEKDAYTEALAALAEMGAA